MGHLSQSLRSSGTGLVEFSLGQQGGIRNNLGCPPNALELAPVERRGPSSFWSASPDPTVSAHGNHVPFKVSLSGARYLFHIFDMTYSMAVEIQPNGINTSGGRYGTFSSDLAPTTKPPAEAGRLRSCCIRRTTESWRGHHGWQR